MIYHYVTTHDKPPCIPSYQKQSDHKTNSPVVDLRDSSANFTKVLPQLFIVCISPGMSIGERSSETYLYVSLNWSHLSCSGVRV